MIRFASFILVLTLLFGSTVPVNAQELCEPGCTYDTDIDGPTGPDTGGCLCGDDIGTPDVVVVEGQNNVTFADLITKQVVPFIDGYVIQFLYVLAFLFFLYGMARFFFFGTGEENRQKGKQFAVYGIVGLVVLFSVWGFVKILLTSIFPGGNWDKDSRSGLILPGGRCSGGEQCRSGVCTLRGVNTSTCE